VSRGGQNKWDGRSPVDLPNIPARKKNRTKKQLPERGWGRITNKHSPLRKNQEEEFLQYLGEKKKKKMGGNGIVV